MVIALIAHDKMKEAMITFAKKYECILSKHTLIATGTTGKRIMENTGLNVHCCKSGPLGGAKKLVQKLLMAK